MKVRVPVIIKDPQVTAFAEIPATEEFTIDGEQFYLDGPVCERVALLDFDDTSGGLVPGARFLPGEPDAAFARYELADPAELSARDVTQVSVFGTVLRTMHMFEEPDALGRRLRWAFGGPQLLVVPRAGEWANAFYERESRSIQLFHFPSGQPDGGTIFTGHSQDIVAHETGHAILDGIAPSLYDAITPQSLALHESIADLTALLMAFRCRPLREHVLRETHGSIIDSSAFNLIAQQFGAAVHRDRPYLRDLLNIKTLDEDSPEPVDVTEPHDLSEVLSGALYMVMVRLHESLKDEYAVSTAASPSLVAEAEEDRQTRADPDATATPPAPHGLAALDPDARAAARERVAIKALAVGADRFKRALFRGLDYLPPGEASFADFGRAVIAADQASHPDSGAQREWIREEFLRRAIVRDTKELSVRTNFRHRSVTKLDLDALVESDWAAYDFANRNHSLLRIPKDTPFKVEPRLDVEKLYYYRDGERARRELLFKVSWTRIEKNDIGAGFPRERRIIVGTTLVIDRETKQVRARLTSEQNRAQREARDALLAKIAGAGRLVLATPNADEAHPAAAVLGEVIGETLRVRGAGRLLHVAREG